MKFTAFILSSCLGHIANASPLRSLSQAPYPVPQPATAPKSFMLSARSDGLANGTVLGGGLNPNYTVIPFNSTDPSANGRELSMFCGADGSSFVDTTTGNSPALADCAGLVDRLGPALDTTAWGYMQENTSATVLVRNGACAFGVYSTALRGRWVWIGGGDVIKVVSESIRRFAGGRMMNATATADAAANNTNAHANETTVAGNATFPRIGAAGAFECAKDVLVNWALFAA